jgi:DNA-binding TFAR19-related protein (PDSD5 family)
MMNFNKELDQEIINWFEKLQSNEPVNLQEFLKQTEDLKQRTLKVVRESVARSVETGMPFDPQLAAAEEAIEANADKIHEKLWELIYKGEVSSKALNDEMVGLLAQIMPKPELAANVHCLSCLGCLGCATCASCASCLMCAVTGIAAFGATATLAASASTATAAAAK